MTQDKKPSAIIKPTFSQIIASLFSWDRKPAKTPLPKNVELQLGIRLRGLY